MCGNSEKIPTVMLNTNTKKLGAPNLSKTSLKK